MTDDTDPQAGRNALDDLRVAARNCRDADLDHDADMIAECADTLAGFVPGADDGDGWEPEPAELRDGEHEDESGHAARTDALIRDGERRLQEVEAQEGGE